MEESKEKNIIILKITAIIILSIILSTLVVVLMLQETMLKNNILFMNIFLFSLTIFSLTTKDIAKKVIGLYKERQLYYYIHILILLVFPLFSWIYNKNIEKGVVVFSLWYILPVSLFLAPKILNLKNYQLFFHIPAVLIMAIGFDTRRTYDVTEGLDGMGYTLNALWVSTLLLLILSLQIDDFTEKFNFSLTLKKMLLVLGLLVILFVILVPIGLLTNFLSWNPQWLGLDIFIVSFIGIFFTIALPEELITRGTMQHQLLARYGKKEVKSWQNGVIIVSVSLIFGASHWNNTSPEFIWAYILLATIAGIIYGLGFVYGGLVSAMLIHTLVDWIWNILFKT